MGGKNEENFYGNYDESCNVRADYQVRVQPV